METNETKKRFDLGPGAIAESSMDSNVRFLIFGNYGVSLVANSDEPKFILSSEEWLTIQCYVAKTLALPDTESKFKTYLGNGAPSDLTDFLQLMNVYKKMIEHVTDWQDNTFPSSVSLASDIYNYSLKVETYYNPILPLAEILVDNPDDQKTKDKLVAIFTILSQEANMHQEKAAMVANKVTAFANRTKEDLIELSGADGKSGLVKYYADKYGTASDEAKAIAKQIDETQEILEKANKEYNHDVVVASTTPCYVWFTVFGPIAAAIVAGIYGNKALKALDAIKAAEQKIKALQAEEQANINLLLILNTTNNGLIDISNSIDKALPVIQTIQGTWQAIADDLKNIIQTIHTNIEEALPIIMDLGVDSAIKSWKDVGKSADKYRQNAYITIKPSEAE